MLVSTMRINSHKIRILQQLIFTKKIKLLMQWSKLLLNKNKDLTLMQRCVKIEHTVKWETTSCVHNKIGFLKTSVDGVIIFMRRSIDKLLSKGPSIIGVELCLTKLLIALRNLLLNLDMTNSESKLFKKGENKIN